MINQNILFSISGILLTITGLCDGYKYHWSANSIRRIGTAKGRSRKFINAALINNLMRISHCILVGNLWVVLSSLFSLIFMIEHWFVVYWYYPYRKRTQFGFKRPSILLYLINSLLPNKIRRRL